MRYLFNSANLVRDAVLTALNIVPSNVIRRIDTDAKIGGGQVKVTGDYVGLSDSTIDVDIVSDEISGTPRISQPVFVGVGNGVMSNVAADNTVEAQQIVVALEDLGTDTRAAYVPFQGVTLLARETGDGGNQIKITINPAGLVVSETAWSVQGGLRAGTNEYLGEEFNFGAVSLTVDGKFPTDTPAPRIRFGLDPMVYRPYRRYRDGQYVYGFSPAPVRDVAAGTRVYAVTGSREVLISNGTVTDTLPDIITAYDCLTAIRNESTLVKVDEQAVVANQMEPGGQGVTDLSVWTRPYVQTLKQEGTDYAKRAAFAIAVDETAPTEELTIRCRDASSTSHETWEVHGPVSGLLATAETGVAYHDGAYSFLIPPPDVDDSQTTGTINVAFKPALRDDSETMPKMCVVKPRLGSAARNGTWRFVLTPRPPEDCECESGEFFGGPSRDCLGVSDTGGDTVSDASRLIRLGRLKEAVSALMQANTSPPSGVDVGDVKWINTSAQILLDCLNKYSVGTTSFGPWAPSTQYQQDEITEPTARNGYRYAVTTLGMSGATEPGTWTTTVGSTVTDGGVTWTNIGKIPDGLWDAMFAAWKTEAEGLDGVEALPRETWQPGHDYGFGNIVVPTVPNGHFYSFLPATAGKSGLQEPQWTTDGSNVEEVDPVTGGTIHWNDEGIDPFTSENVSPSFFARYRSQAAAVLAAAGIDENFDRASTDGDGCWQDFNDRDSWWEYDGDALYKPVQTGHYYPASVGCNDEDGHPTSQATREFGFGVKFGTCESALKYGDTIEVTIAGIPGGGNGYQQGDIFTAAIVRAVPLEMGGGQAGDDTLTWTVIGRVDGVDHAYAPYYLHKTALAPYSDAGLGFSITPGALPYQLGDRYTFSIEGGRMRWRRDGGAWSDEIEIDASISLVDGLAAEFVGGSAPSWVAGDRWTYRVEAINGPDGIRSPTDARMQWVGSTVIDITPQPGREAVDTVLLADHTIPADATIVLQASDDDFVTHRNYVLPWHPQTFQVPIALNASRYRLDIDRGGSLQWLCMGESEQPTLPNNVVELGKIARRRRLPSATRRAGLGVQVVHESLSSESADALVDAIVAACENDQGRFGIVPHDAMPNAAIVTTDSDTIDTTELMDFQPARPDQMHVSVSLTLNPIP